MILTNQKSDNLGAIASTLCLIHCVFTPFLFIVQVGSATYSDAPPMWWGFIDIFFLIISFFAVYRSTQTTTKNWMKVSLWISWLLLFLIIVNEKMAWFPLNESMIYFPAIALIILHLYNKKYCQCNTTICHTNKGERAK